MHVTMGRASGKGAVFRLAKDGGCDIDGGGEGDGGLLL